MAGESSSWTAEVGGLTQEMHQETQMDITEEILAKVRWVVEDVLESRGVPVRVEKKSEEKKLGLHPESKRILTHIGANPYRNKTQFRMELQAMHPEVWKKHFTPLLDLGFVEVVEAVGRRGRKFEYPVLTEKGKDEILNAGLPVACRLVKRGDHKHEIYCRWFADFMTRKHKPTEVCYDKRVGTGETKDADILLRLPGGGFVIGEVYTSRTARENVKSLLKAMAVEGVVKVYGIVEDRQLLEEMKTLLEKLDVEEGKVELVHVGEFAPHYGKK